jgi:hypothetical protein
MRRQFGAHTNLPRPYPAATRPAAKLDRFPMGTVFFEYIGATAITAIGAATGQQYRFSSPGATVTVDARDRWSLAKVPNLREI